MKKPENDRGKSQVWRNSTSTTTTASSVASPQTVCVCVCVSERAPECGRERESEREDQSLHSIGVGVLLCAASFDDLPASPQNLHSVLSVAEVGQSKRPRGLSVPVNTSSTFRRSA